MATVPHPPSSTRAPARSQGLLALALAAGVLAALLAFLFAKSFRPEMVLFSNDAPLGLIAAASGQQASTTGGLFTGYWQDLNWLGIEQPAILPGLSFGLYLIFQDPVVNAKFYGPASLFILGLSAWLFFRQLGFRQSVCVLGGIAAALNSNTFSHVCWGLPSRALSQAAVFLALAAIQSATRGNAWAKAALGGMAVGLAVMEGFDVGALYSLYVAAFAFFAVLAVEGGGPAAKKLPRAAAFVVLIALCAGWFAAHALTTLIGTQIKGVAGAAQEPQTREERQRKYDNATYWSLPKKETLRVLIPGLFGYRMDTEGGGNYWGGVGEQPGLPRHSGAGEYAGVLVALVGAWAAAHAFRKKGGVFTGLERKHLLFWTVAGGVSILFAWGRHAPFYQLVYALPYFSTIRNPVKFMHFFHLSLLVLFAFGLEGLLRLCSAQAGEIKQGLLAAFKNWWKCAAPFDRKWLLGAGAAGALGLFGFLVYYSSNRELASHLGSAGFQPDLAASIAKFTYRETALFLVTFAVSLGAVAAILSGWFGGARVKAAVLLLGAILVVDLARANQPWITYYDYKERYASGPLFELLKQNAHERRVTAKFFPFGGQYLVDPQNQQVAWFANLCNTWLQNQFQYHNIASLEVIQMSRMPELDGAFLRNFQPAGNSDSFLLGRLWELTSTKWFIAQREYLDVLNNAVLPGRNAFKLHAGIGIAARRPYSSAERLGEDDISAEINPQGPFAVIEFTNALPRAKLFTQWRGEADDQKVLAQLRDPAFDPGSAVLISGGIPAPANTNSAPASASYERYSPKEFSIKTESAAPGVLLVNDKYSPNWKVFVDGREETLLRCNYMMRGVQVPAGAHTVEFQYRPPVNSLWVTLSAMAAALALAGFLAVDARRTR